MFIQRLLLGNYVHGIKKINLPDMFTTIPIEVTIKGERSYKISL